jgi:hypothetical protein
VTCFEYDGQNENPKAFSPVAPPNVYDGQGAYPGFTNMSNPSQASGIFIDAIYLIFVIERLYFIYFLFFVFCFLFFFV